MLREVRMLEENDERMVEINNYCRSEVDERFMEDCKIDMRNMNSVSIGMNSLLWRNWRYSNLMTGQLNNGLLINSGIKEKINWIIIIVISVIMIAIKL